MTGVAAVQARIAEIQGQFARPTTSQAPSVAGSGASSFAQALAAEQTSRVGGSTPSAATAPVGAGAAGSLGEQAVAMARSQLGTPYVWGGNKPGGFDCSGLLQWSYKQLGIDIPRVSNDQKNAGRAVSAAEARPGDLVFFERGRIDHIGMYAGDGKWIVAPKTGDVVKVQDVDLSKATTIRRVVPDAPAAAATTASAAGAGSFAVASTAPGGSASPYASLFATAGAKHGVSPALLTALARAESGFDPAARSGAGAQGLMQFMPATARGLGIDPWQPNQAIDGAARLLASHLQRFGSTELALAAYNAGPGAVTRHGGIPPYRETQNYVSKIMNELRGVAA